MPQTALDYAQTHRDQALDALIELLKIPSISTLPERASDMRTAVDWLCQHLESAGLEHVQVLETQGHPAVYADWTHAPDKPTVLVYGHYDVQPVDPIEEWNTPPFEPSRQGDDLVARGASDDKGQFLAHIKAAEAWLKSRGALPVNLKFLIEGEEEIGSAHLTPVLKEHAKLLEADVCLVSDSNILAPDRPSLVYGLRGLVYAEIKVQGPSADLHSGRYGGAVHNPLQALCELIAKLHDDQGRVTVPGFYDHVRALDPAEAKEMAALDLSDEAFLSETGAPATWGEAGFTTLERIGARPTLEIHGIRGGFSGEGAKTVIPAKALAKVSMRLVPHQSHEAVAQAFKAHVENLAPQTVRVSVNLLQTCAPVLTERQHPAIQAASSAYEKSFGRAPVFTLDGGSIPVVEAFQTLYGLPVVLMGFGLPDDRLHSPNEKFHLPNFYHGIDCSIHFMHELAG